jgi:hypothetical protein
VAGCFRSDGGEGQWAPDIVGDPIGMWATTQGEMSELSATVGEADDWNDIDGAGVKRAEVA